MTVTALSSPGNPVNLTQTVAVTRAYADPIMNVSFTNTTYYLNETATVTLSIEGLAASATQNDSYFTPNG